MKIAIAAVLMGFAPTLLLGQSVPAEQQPAPQHLDRRIRVSERVLDANVVHRVLPQPPWSKDKGHEQGVVTIAVMVDYNGTVKSMSAVSGDPVLAEVAMGAVKQWQFRPYIVQGDPLQVESRVVMKFSKKHAEIVLGER
jgi:protein TonB